MSTKKVEQLEINQGILKDELKAEKKEVADLKIEKLQDNMEYTAKNVEQLGIIKEELKSQKKKVDDMKKQVKCPVCLEVPRKGPVFNCPNGHLVCQECKRESCPICRAQMRDNRSLLAIAVIENILHDCKNIECGEKYPLDNIKKHEKVCKHRVVACPFYDCNVRVPLSKRLNHFERYRDCSQSTTPSVIDGSSETLYLEIEIEDIQHSLLYCPVTTYCMAGHYLRTEGEQARG